MYPATFHSKASFPQKYYSRISTNIFQILEMQISGNLPKATQVNKRNMSTVQFLTEFITLLISKVLKFRASNAYF